MENLKKILIVDDHAVNRRLLKAQLKSGPFTVVDVADGKEALAVLDKEGADIVISDILMPNIDGYHFCMEVRNRPKLRLTPIILYTSTHIGDDGRKSAFDCGADYYLEKP